MKRIITGTPLDNLEFPKGTTHVHFGTGKLTPIMTASEFPKDYMLEWVEGSNGGRWGQTSWSTADVELHDSFTLVAVED